MDVDGFLFKCPFLAGLIVIPSNVDQGQDTLPVDNGPRSCTTSPAAEAGATSVKEKGGNKVEGAQRGLQKRAGTLETSAVATACIEGNAIKLEETRWLTR